MTGAIHGERGRDRVLSWLERRYSWGFSEWRSSTYSQFDIDAVATLADLAPDSAVATRAAIVLDLLLLDSAVHSFHGHVASSRGRNYGYGGPSGDISRTQVLNWLLGGPTVPDSRASEVAVISVCLTTGLQQSKFVMSQVIVDIASNIDRISDEIIVRERIGIGPENAGLAAELGLSLSDPSHAFTWMELGCYTHPLTVPLIVEAGKQYQLFTTESGVATVYDTYKFLQNSSAAEQRTKLEAKLPLTYYGSLGTAETVYWRSKDAALASVSDFRKGGIGDQIRSWQATVGTAGTMVFTTYPGPDIVPDSDLFERLLGKSIVASSWTGGGSNQAKHFRWRLLGWILDRNCIATKNWTVEKYDIGAIQATSKSLLRIQVRPVSS